MTEQNQPIEEPTEDLIAEQMDAAEDDTGCYQLAGLSAFKAD